MVDTGRIKERLNNHRVMMEDLEALKTELNFAISKYGSIQSPGFSSMPHGSGGRSDKIAMQVIQKMELENRIARKEEQINADKELLLPYIENLKPSEKLLITLRYFYCAPWTDVCKSMYGGKKDYEEELDLYMNRTFKIHGRALLALAEMLKE